MTAVLSSPSPQYSFSPFSEKRYERVATTPISTRPKSKKSDLSVNGSTSQHNAVKSHTGVADANQTGSNDSTPVRSAGRRRRVNNSNGINNSVVNHNGNKSENTPSKGVIELVKVKAINNSKPTKSQVSSLTAGIRSIKSQHSQPSTPSRQVSDPNRYAGPTFHASPAPSNLPVPKFVSQSVPTRSVTLHNYFDQKGLSRSPSPVASSAPSSPSKITSSQTVLERAISAANLVCRTTESMESSVTANASTSKPVAIPIANDSAVVTAPSSTLASTGGTSKTTRFGDSVVFKPRRRAGNATA
ncbi:hypothetical protein V1511DRAFT_487544 [Dipodascopsis uninucleata]